MKDAGARLYGRLVKADPVAVEAMAEDVARTRTVLGLPDGERGAVLVSDIERLASRTGLGVEQNGQRVILRVLPEGKSHSKD